MCSSSRSVIYTGRHLPHTAIYDNDNMPYIRPLDPALGTLGTMLRAAATTPPTRASGTCRTPMWIRRTRRRRRMVGTVRVLRVERLGRHRRRRLGGAAGRPGDRRASRRLVAQPGPVSRRRPTVVHGGQLREPTRHHELRLRQSVECPTAAGARRTRWRCGRPPTSRCTSDSGTSTLPASVARRPAGAAPAVREYAEVMDVCFGDVDGDERWRQG